MDLEALLQHKPYALGREEKQVIFSEMMNELTRYHYTHCEDYKRLCDRLKESMPLIPVRLFKLRELLSVPKEEVVKVMTSSGTSGQVVSKIYLDRQTAAMQTKVLAKIMSEYLGPKRLPMLVIDTKAVIKNRRLFSARGAGILGFAMLGYDVTYALDEEMNLDIEAIQNFMQKHKDEDILLFGFTYMIWQHFAKVIQEQHIAIDLSRGILIHGGGWKKLESEAVDEEAFKAYLQKICGIKHVHNYYGMVEQTGSIYVACECGRLHASNFSDITIRNPQDFKPCKMGEVGIIQLDSLLPHSYPGHRLLTEDEGVLLGEDDCPCGRKGKTFKVIGRLKNAEIRGCSDTYEVRN